ncbi:hypothetical protein [Haliscomenobacter sp.]|uniref:hypothetical protein n=1 Tax=Haliscomenobacter sp. TaxID=2717303 RepID=UPI0033651D4E
MKKSIFNLAIPITLFAALLFTGCQSPAQKVDNAETNVNDANQNLKDAKADEMVANKKAVAAEEWKAFRAETEIKIKDNEARITELRAKKKTTGKTLDAAYTQRIDTLEQKNLDMRTMMDDYESTNISSDWEEFKREFNHDMEELGMALKNLTVSNKK